MPERARARPRQDVGQQVTPPSTSANPANSPGTIETVNSGAIRLSVIPLAPRSCTTCWNEPTVADASVEVVNSPVPAVSAAPESGIGPEAPGPRAKASEVAASRPAVLA